MSRRDCEGLSKWELDTPCLVIDADILEENIRAMQAYAAAFGKQLRPHAKTHKCSQIAKMQTEAGCIGICVAKVSEAEVLVENGFQGVLITSPAHSLKGPRFGLIIWMFFLFLARLMYILFIIS